MKIDAHAKPDFEEFERVIKGEKQPTRVHLVELGIDGEVVCSVMENVLGRKSVPNTEETRTQHVRQHLEFYTAMGYDFAMGWGGFDNLPQLRTNRAKHTGITAAATSWK